MYLLLMLDIYQEVYQSELVTIPNQVQEDRKEKDINHFRGLLKGTGIRSYISRNISIQYLNVLKIIGWTSATTTYITKSEKDTLINRLCSAFRINISNTLDLPL